MPVFFRQMTLTRWIMVSIAAGVLVGWLFPRQAQSLQFLSGIFLHLIKCIVVPLIFSTLVVGIAGHAGDLKSVGRLALKSIIYFEVVTVLALVVGLAAVNFLQPGKGVTLNASADTGRQLATTPITFDGFIDHVTPQSFFDSAARNDVLQVVIFAILFAVAAARAREKSRHFMLQFCESLSDIMFKFTGIVMCFAPLGVGGAIAATIGKNGFAIMFSLGKLVFTLYGALLVFVLIVLVPVMLIARIPVLAFFKAVRQPALLAFSTASSEAALPDALKLMEKFGVPRRIVAFVLPAGYSFNLDGSTLYLAVAALFVAQAAGLHLTLSQQLPIMLTLILTSKGVAAVPRASLVILSATLVTFGLPLEGVAVILGVDAFLDMARTTLNLVGNCLAAAVMARWEGEFDEVAAKQMAMAPVTADD